MKAELTRSSIDKTLSKLNMDLNQNIHGGTNYYVAKNRDFVLEVVHPHGETTADGAPKMFLLLG